VLQARKEGDGRERGKRREERGEKKAIFTFLIHHSSFLSLLSSFLSLLS
jgi:hypothetical protein